MERAKVLLIILDGWGLSGIEEGNAPLIGKTPVLDKVYSNYPTLSLTASGLQVGLNSGEMGNSEVGHLNIGSGRVVWEMLPLIDQSIKEGSFFENKTLQSAIEYTKKTGGRLQLVGLCSSGGVHSHINHLISLIDFAKGENTKSLYLHLITDGRDTGPKDAERFINLVEEKIRKTRLGKIASLIGRYFAMDRDNNWDRVKLAYDLMVNGVGDQYKDADSALTSNYRQGKGDEYIRPSIIDSEGCIKPGDAVIFFNFREDRGVEILKCFEEENFSGFKRPKISDLFVVSMTKYFEEQKSPSVIAPNNLANVIADLLQNTNLKQFHTAETEKYAHVTYFFNGGNKVPHKGEQQVMVPSPKVATYDLKPEMSAAQVANKVCGAVTEKYDFIVVNFANGDMVGHTGKLDAAVKAVEVVDSCLGKVLIEASKNQYHTFITADHGNCEMMIDPATRQPSTEHTTSPVPLCYLNLQAKPFTETLTSTLDSQKYLIFCGQPPIGVLADIGPSILELFNIERPPEMVGRSLLHDFPG